MTVGKISWEAAQAFWEHPTQRPEGISADMLPKEGVEYWACGPICGAFRAGPYPGIFMADYGVKPEGWGKLLRPASKILNAFWIDHEPQAVHGWTECEARAALAFSRRLGFREIGRFSLENGVQIIMQVWRPEWA